MKRFAVDVENINFDEDIGLEERTIPYKESVKNSINTNHTPQTDICVVDNPPPLVAPSELVVDVKSITELSRKIHDDANFVFKHPQQTQAQASPRQKIKDVRVFCNFLALQGKKCSFNIRLKDNIVRGVDVVDSTIRTFLSSDDKLRSRYSENPRLYKLFMADDYTGEEEAPIQLDSACGNFSCFSVVPLPPANLYLFPCRDCLLAPPVDDVTLHVDVRCAGKAIRRPVVVPADLEVAKLESYLSGKFAGSALVPGSLRIRFGPCELSVADKYDFGAGCGGDLQLLERTLQSLWRFGVTDVIVEGTVTQEEPSSLTSDGNLDQLKRLDEEEARAYQQFDVIKINKFGVRQQRVIGVDGERVYNMRPLSEVGKTKNPERLIEDIEFIRDYRDRPTYCEIEYSKAAKYDTDRIECGNAYDCALLVEKLRMLKRIHGRRQDLKRSDTAISRIFSKLGFGK